MVSSSEAKESPPPSERIAIKRPCAASGTILMMGQPDMERSDLETLLGHITQDIIRYYPKTLILFGSAARYLHGGMTEAPEDIDLIHVGTMSPIDKKKYDLPVDLFFFDTREIISIARTLRYLPKAAARAKMFMKDNWKGYVRADIAACLLLGKKYPEYGFLQMEDEEKPRDYSTHAVLHGEPWWRALQEYAQDHRGALGLGIDKTLGLDRFVEPAPPAQKV